MTGATFLLAMAVLTTLLVGAEWLRGVRNTEWRTNLAAWALQLGVSATLLQFVPLWQGHALLDGAVVPFWVAFAIFLVVADLGEYLYHRAQHRIPLLWAMHSLHHSDREMATLTTARHFWGDQLVKKVTIWSAAAMVIAPTETMATAYAVASLWNLVAHSALPIDLGRWSWLINTPVYHRRHHSNLPEHYDSNFAALLPIFDLIAGTYHRGGGMPPTGLDRHPRSFGEVVAWPLLVSGWWRAWRQTKAA